ncbi:MAG: hypothetical protein ACLFQG_06260 [Desulfovermiculus sp.]
MAQDAFPAGSEARDDVPCRGPKNVLPPEAAGERAGLKAWLAQVPMLRKVFTPDACK